MKVEHTADMAALLAQAGWLRRFARALVGNADDADDLAQDTLVSAWRHPRTGRAWLATVARHLAVDRFRSNARRARREEDARHLGSVTTPEELIGNAQIHRHVAEAVASLPQPFRQALVLRFYEGLSAADIARQLGEPEGTIRWRIKDGLARVRRDLDARHGQDRSAWVAALGPLLPRPPRAPRPPRTAHGFPTALAVTALGLLSLTIVALVLHRPQPRAAATANESAPPTERAPARAPASVRLSLPQSTDPATGTAEPSPADPGRADAQSLAEELLRAIQGNDYDAFVAKGSAYFRAAVAPSAVASLNTKLSARLSQGHRVSTLGSVRRAETVDWVFRIEFADGGDDALVILPLDGWQAAGFLINEPMNLPVENTP